MQTARQGNWSRQKHLQLFEECQQSLEKVGAKGVVYQTAKSKSTCTLFIPDVGAMDPPRHCVQLRCGPAETWPGVHATHEAVP